MFSQKEFVDASRKFVCVRLESYESKAHQDMVRALLGGRFENTAFCLFAPDGKERLSGTGRSPEMGLRTGRPGTDPEIQAEKVIAEMARIARRYEAKGAAAEAVVQDFHSFRQALDVAAADQRLLVFVVAEEGEAKALRDPVRAAFNAPENIGRFHWDFFDAASDAKWRDAVEGEKPGGGIFVIRAGQFGTGGDVVAQLPASAEAADLTKALAEANAAFSAEEKRKVYGQHVAEGRRQGIYFERDIPYGEDRDGDGVIDHRGGLDRRQAGANPPEERLPPRGSGRGIRRRLPPPGNMPLPPPPE